MVYITVKQSPAYHQMTLEEFLFQEHPKSTLLNANTVNTRTYAVERVNEHFLRSFDIDALIRKLNRYNQSTAELREKDRRSLYHTFYIPKKSGGLRRIDAPRSELMGRCPKLSETGVFYPRIGDL